MLGKEEDGKMSDDIFDFGFTAVNEDELKSHRMPLVKLMSIVPPSTIHSKSLTSFTMLLLPF